MTEREKIYYDYGFLIEENKMLRDQMNHWKLMYEQLSAKHEDLFKSYDALVMETLNKDLCND